MFINRPKCVFAVVLTFFFICLWIMPCPASAVVREVTLFPDSARVSATAAISSPSANLQRAVMVLPPQADPESLLVSPPASGRVRIDDIQIKTITRLDEEKIAKLRAQIKKAQNEKKDMQARMKALDTQLMFWQAQTRAKTKSVAESDSLASAIGRNCRKILAEKNTIETDLENHEKNLKDLQDQLNQAAGRAEKAWEVTVTMSGPASAGTLLNYSYILGGCGWRPLYRLEALPSSDQIVFSWDAEVWQSTGEDWNQAQVHLATLQPVRTISPRDLPPWIIKPREVIAYKSTRKARSAPAAMEKEEVSDNAPAVTASAPVESSHTTYSSWSLGKKTIPAGSPQRLNITEETWPARFLFLARPSISPQAFLQASVKLAKPADIPAGQASFMIDGALIGKRPFSLAGSETDIYFGESPMITVRSLTIAHQSGATRIFQNRQTCNWLWRIEAKNNSGSPARLRIEEPVPQSRDERIRLSFKHQPEPSEKDTGRFVWFLDLPAMQQKNIETGVELTAPGDMVIDFGWRN